MRTHLGSREAPLSGTGSNLMFFFPYIRYILGAGEKWLGGGAKGPIYLLIPFSQFFPADSRSVSFTHTPPHLVT